MRSNGFMIKIRNRQGVVWNTEAEFYARPGENVREPGREININEVIDQRANEMPDIQLPLVPWEQIPAVPIENDPEEVPPNAPIMNGPVQFVPQQIMMEDAPQQIFDVGAFQPIMVDNAGHFQNGDPGVNLLYVDDDFYEEFSD